MPVLISNCRHAKSFQKCPTLCDPMDCSPPGSSVHGILQARILTWVVMPSSRGSSHPGTEPTSLKPPPLAGGFFTISTTWEVLSVTTWSNSIVYGFILRTNFFPFHLQSHCWGTCKLFPSSSSYVAGILTFMITTFPILLIYLLSSFLTPSFRTETNRSWATTSREENLPSSDVQ